MCARAVSFLCYLLFECVCVCVCVCVCEGAAFNTDHFFSIKHFTYQGKMSAN